MKLSEIIKLANQQYNKKLRLVRKYEDGFRNAVFKMKDEMNGKFFVLIVYKKEERIKETIENAHAVAQFLKAKNFPTRIPLNSITNNYFEEIIPGRFLALYPFLYGESIPWEAYKRRHLKSIGKTLSNMHSELQYLNRKDLPSWQDEINKEINFMEKYFRKVEPWIQRKLQLKLNWENILEILKTPMALKNNKAIVLHYDFVRGNILFSGLILKDDTYEITGILDFEKVCTGPAIIDIARTLSFLIVDCKYKNEEEIKKWFLLRGYSKRGNHKAELNKILLENLVEVFLLRDFYKFLLHNPFENLGENEHYLRTVMKLKEKGLLTVLK